MNVKNRRIAVVTIDTTSALYVNNTIPYRFNNINFIPDEVILRSISVANIDASNECFILSSNLVPNNIMGSHVVTNAQASNQNPQTVFTLGYPITGSYNFTLLDSNGNLTPTMNNMVVTLCLEFVEYHKN